MMNGPGSGRARWFAVFAAIAVLLVTGGGLVGPAAADPGQDQGTAVSGDRGKSPSDPDGMDNGGADKPGGQGGTIGAQDGNNGSGNDIDCEDDNRGQGVPGHCKAKPDDAKCLPSQAKGRTNGRGHGKGRAARTTCTTPPSESSESSEPNSSSPTPATPGTPRASDTGDTTTGSNAGPATTEGTTGTADASSAGAGSSTGEVLGVEASRTSAGTSANAEVAGVHAATAPSVSATPTTAILANTGAGKALGLLLALGVVTVAAGAWLLAKRGGRASQKV
jgi:hypothetical protein